jgi:Ca2+-binding RTX toxin-like protein
VAAIARFRSVRFQSPCLTGSGGQDTLTANRLTFQAYAAAVNWTGSVAVRVNGGSADNTLTFASNAAAAGTSSSGGLLPPPGGNPPISVTNWNLTSFGSGKVAGVGFSGFAILVGGAGVDVFHLTPGMKLAASIDGGGGGDWLDYSAFSTAVTVNLAAGTATNVGLIRNIQNVRGGSGDDVLTGDARGNILVGGAGADTIFGGSGRSVLIGGAGADTIVGGAGDDLIIGGTTSFDANVAALMSIFAEWQSPNSYATRVGHLKLGGGLNGTNKLVFGLTVHDDQAANVLTGAAGLDWFFAGKQDTITDRESGELVN